MALVVGQVDLKNILDALVRQHARHAHRDAALAVLAVQVDRQRHDHVIVVQDSGHDAGNRGANAKLGAALARDNGPAALAHAVHDLVKVHVAHAGVLQRHVLAQRDALHRDVRRGNEGRVAVLAHADGLDLLGVNANDLGQGAAQAGRVKQGARAKNLATGQAHVAVEVLGHHVTGVRDADQDAVEAALAKRGHDAVQDLQGAVEHLQARLAGAARAASGENGKVGIGAIGVVAHANDEVVAQARGQILEVKGLRSGGLFVDVDKNDLVYQVLEHEAQRAVRAHATRADDDRLTGPNLVVHKKPPMTTPCVTGEKTSNKRTW